MQKKVILPLLLSCSLLTPATEINSSFLSAEQSIVDMDCVEFQIGRNKINEEIHELKRVEYVSAVEMAISEEIIEEEIEVYPTYNPYNILEPSNLTREQMYKVLEGTALENVARMYVWLEEIYGINALFMASLSAEESAWGTSYLAQNNNNLGGIKSRDGGWAYFDSWQSCLEYKAELLYNQYLSEDGAYFNGYSIYDINQRYCEPNSRGTYGWSENINDIAYGLLNKLY